MPCNKAVVSNIAGMVHVQEFNYTNTSIRLSTIHIQSKDLATYNYMNTEYNPDTIKI